MTTLYCIVLYCVADCRLTCWVDSLSLLLLLHYKC